MTQQCEKINWKPLFSAGSCNFLFFSTVYGYSYSVKNCFIHSILYWVCFNKEQELAFSNLVSPEGCHSFPSHPLWLALHLSPNVWMKRAWGSQYVHTHTHTHTHNLMGRLISWKERMELFTDREKIFSVALLCVELTRFFLGPHLNIYKHHCDA